MEGHVWVFGFLSNTTIATSSSGQVDGASSHACMHDAWMMNSAMHARVVRRVQIET